MGPRAQLDHPGRGLRAASFPERRLRELIGASLLISLTTVAGYLIVLDPRVLLIALAIAFVAVCASNLTIARFVLLVVVCLIPFHAFLSTNGVPSWWKEALLALLLASVVLREGVRHNALLLPTGVFMMAVLLAAGLSGRFGSLDLAPYLAFVPLVLILPGLTRSHRDLDRLFAVLVVGGLVNAAIVIYGSLAGVDLFESYGNETPVLGTQRASSFAGSALLTATLLSALAAGSFGALLTRSTKRPSASFLRLAGVVGLFAAACVHSLTRGAVVGPLVALILTPLLVILLARRSRASRVRASGVLLVALLALIGVGASVTTTSSYEERLTVFSGLTASSDATRASRWHETLKIGLSSPLVGEGPGFTGLSRIRETLGPDPAYFPNYLPVPVSESNLFKVFAELGVLGSLACIWLVLVAARELWIAAAVHRTALIILVVLAALFAQGLFLQTMESYIGAAMFWGTVGIAATVGRLDATVDRERE